MGKRSKYWITAYFCMETSGNEWSYGKLYSDNMPDGYNTHSVRSIEINLGDMTTAPNSPTFKRTGDYVSPSLIVSNLQNGQLLNGSSLTLKGSASDYGTGLEGIYVKVNGGGYVKSTGTTSWSNALTLIAGANTVKVYALDKANNFSATNTYSVRVVTGRVLTIDGVNDFDKSRESILTTADGYTNYVTWNSETIYFGTYGVDVGKAPTDANHNWWILVYISTNTNGPTGSTLGDSYDTQQPTLPFKAQYHFRVKADKSWSQLETNNSTWGAASFTGTVAQTGNYMEIAFPTSNLGNKTKYYMTALFIYENKVGTDDWSYSGMYTGNFVNAVDPNLTKYIRIDLSDTTTAPNSSTFEIVNDYIAPTIAITTPAASSYVATNHTVSGTASDIGKGCEGSVVQYGRRNIQKGVRHDKLVDEPEADQREAKRCMRLQRITPEMSAQRTSGHIPPSISLRRILSQSTERRISMYRSVSRRATGNLYI